MKTGIFYCVRRNGQSQPIDVADMTIDELLVSSDHVDLAHLVKRLCEIMESGEKP